MLLRLREVGELRDDGKTANRGECIRATADHVGQEAERGELHHRAALTDRAFEIQPNHEVVENEQRAGNDRERRNPSWGRTADQVAATRPSPDDDQHPERERSELITGQHAARDFRHDVISRGEGQRREPEGKHTLGEPTGGDGLHHTTHRHHEKRDVGDREEPGKQKKRGKHIPLRGVARFVATPRPGEDAGDSDRAIRDQQERLHVARELQEAVTRGVTGDDADQCERDAEIPKQRAHRNPVTGAQGFTTEAGQNPEAERQSSVGEPTVNKRGLLERLHVPISEPSAARKERRRVQLDGGDERQYAADDEPDEAGAQQEQQRPTGVGVIGGNFLGVVGHLVQRDKGDRQVICGRRFPARSIPSRG